MKNDFLKNLSENSNEDLIDLLKNRQNEFVYDAIIAAKQILEKRNIDTTQYKIREKNIKDEKKFELSTFLSNAAVFLIFLGGFGIGGIYLILSGYEENNYPSIIIGILIASLGFGHILMSYFDRIPKIGMVLTYIPAIIIFGLITVFVLGLMIIPFSDGINLSVDLGILIIKDGFVRFALIILDCILVYKLFDYIKIRIKDRNKKAS